MGTMQPDMRSRSACIDVSPKAPSMLDSCLFITPFASEKRIIKGGPTLHSTKSSTQLLKERKTSQSQGLCLFVLTRAPSLLPVN